MQAAAAAAASCRRHLIGNRLLRLQLLHLRVSHGGVRDTRWRGMQRQDVPGSEARGSGGRPASEEIDRDYLEYNDPARLDYCVPWRGVRRSRRRVLRSRVPEWHLLTRHYAWLELASCRR
ncbi:hypothetical protein MUK42_27242 [Musa troglodytarum]|uniref:Uncharacterized protein n=1 Tax=Musa troglodytarum TaxID=320322 RepID=A0A9E7EYT8_9LILI|nr:hypothetical protein MUK42_27242 [Musa troglodytarum]